MDKLVLLESQRDFETHMEDLILHIVDPLVQSTKIDTMVAADELRDLLIKSNLDFDKVEKTLLGRGNDHQRVKLLMSQLNDIKVQLLYSVILNHNRAYGDSVSKFEWSLKIIMGTNSLKTLQMPILELNLQGVNGNGVFNYKYEMKKEVVAKFISLLECQGK